MRYRTKLMALCALSILAEPSLALDETASSPSSSSSSSQSSSAASQSPAASFADHVGSLGHGKDQFAGDKRASAYRSEFKRLPLFTFGLGKRGFAEPSFDGANKVQRGDLAFGMGKRGLFGFSGVQDKRLISRLMTTGLGKRSAPRYLTTGLGKRTISRLRTTGLGKRPQDSYVMGLGKRGEWKNAGFGLGKRPSLKDRAFGLGKRMSGWFGLGRRSPGSVGFGLGKRSTNSMGFGLGRRSTNSMGFGLGKRNHYDDDGDVEADDEEEIDYDELLDAYSQDKRKFDLGLGKRVIEMYDELPEEEKRGNNLNFGMGKRYVGDEDEEDDEELFE